MMVLPCLYGAEVKIRDDLVRGKETISQLLRLVLDGYDDAALRIR